MKKKYDGDEDKTATLTGVDKNNLDDEWANYGKTLYEYGVYLADAIEHVSDIKDKIELHKSTFGNAIRSDPDDYGLLKLTDRAVEELIIAGEEYQSLAKELRQSERTVGVLKSAVTSLNKKQYSLDWVTKLFRMHYYADKLPEDFIQEQYDIKEVHMALQDKLKNKGEEE